MPTGCRTFWVARRGNRPEEYEDAFATDAAAGRYALADGATESGFAGLWARILVKGFVENVDCDLDRWPASLAALQERWYGDVRSRPLAWYGEARVEQGAFATFLGVVLTATNDGSYHWQAVAVGDSCLFHTRGAALLDAFPIDRSAQFNNLPALLGSRKSADRIRQDRTLWTHGTGRPDDRLWMMTDALAQWCLAEHEAGRNPWEEMESLLTPPETEEVFASWIESLRDTRGLRNDDVTLLFVGI